MWWDERLLERLMGRFTDLDPTVHVASGTKVELAVAFCGVKTLSAVKKQRKNG